MLPNADGTKHRPGCSGFVTAHGPNDDVLARAARWTERGVSELGSRAAFIAFCERPGTIFEEYKDQSERASLVAYFSDFTDGGGSIHRFSEVLGDLSLLECPTSVQIVSDAGRLPSGRALRGFGGIRSGTAADMEKWRTSTNTKSK